MKIILIFAFLVIVSLIRAQQTIETDTVHRHEASLSVLPVIAVFAGYPAEGAYVNYNFSYKRYFKNNYVLRTAFVLFPPHELNPFLAGYTYHKNLDTINVYRLNNARAKARLQLNLGLEKIFRMRRLHHGYGAEIFAFRSVTDYDDLYRWFPVNVDPNSAEALNYSAQKDWPGIYNKVDSLSSSYQRVTEGAGIQLFYSLRFRIAPRFYLSSTFGPYVSAGFVHFRHRQGPVPSWTNGRQFNLDATILISDLSLAFRF